MLSWSGWSAAFRGRRAPGAVSGTTVAASELGATARDLRDARGGADCAAASGIGAGAGVARARVPRGAAVATAGVAGSASVDDRAGAAPRAAAGLDFGATRGLRAGGGDAATARSAAVARWALAKAGPGADQSSGRSCGRAAWQAQTQRAPMPTK